MDSRAYILHVRPWRDTSVLLDLFCRERGRLRVAARGVKGKKRSPLSGLLQPFIPLQLQLKQSNDYFYLADAEATAAGWSLPGNASLCALYCNELLIRLLPEQDSHPELFDDYQHGLQQLSASADVPVADLASAAVLRQFEWALLTELGYGFALDVDENGEPLREQARYQIHAERGIYLAESTSNSFAADDLLRWADHNWLHNAAEAKRLLRLLLGAHLGSEPLHTRELWRARQVLKQLADEQPLT